MLSAVKREKNSTCSEINIDSVIWIQHEKYIENKSTKHYQSILTTVEELTGDII